MRTQAGAHWHGRLVAAQPLRLALSGEGGEVSLSDASLPGEFAIGGLERADAVVSYDETDRAVTVSHVFDPTQTATVRRWGVYNDSGELIDQGVFPEEFEAITGNVLSVSVRMPMEPTV